MLREPFPLAQPMLRTAIVAAAAAQAEAPAQQAAPVALIPPAIGVYWVGQGGEYAGLSICDDGLHAVHLILAVADTGKDMNHADATDWAATVEADGHKDFTLPNRHDGLTLLANLKDRFGGFIHWLKPQHAAGSDYAWCQYFGNGLQLIYLKYGELRARAVRSLIIQ